MRRLPIGLASIALVVTACSSAEPLTEQEAQWCRATQPPFRLLEIDSEHGFDLTEIVEEAQLAYEAEQAIGNRENANLAAYAVLEEDGAYIELCRILYDEADRPFDPEE